MKIIPHSKYIFIIWFVVWDDNIGFLLKAIDCISWWQPTSNQHTKQRCWNELNSHFLSIHLGDNEASHDWTPNQIQIVFLPSASTYTLTRFFCSVGWRIRFAVYFCTSFHATIKMLVWIKWTKEAKASKQKKKKKEYEQLTIQGAKNNVCETKKKANQIKCISTLWHYIGFDSSVSNKSGHLLTLEQITVEFLSRII